ncbi:MAG TPA: hypothetical protein VH308_04300 [Terracidiphilus sp.]|nr:hypothetical protein [Terracidiphilus sp.]
MKLIWLATAGLCGLLGLVARAVPALNPWEQPAAALAEQIAGILGPGEARLSIHNLSSMPAEDLPAIRRLLETALKGHGVTVSESDSANSVRVTLSENARERMWVAEVAQGTETRVAMIDVGPIQSARASTMGGLTLRKQIILSTRDPLLAVMDTPSGLIALSPEQIVFYANGPGGWQVKSRVGIPQKRALARDPRGILLASVDGQKFEAWLPGVQCTGQISADQSAGASTVQCHGSDDPWPIAGASPQVSPALVDGLASPNTGGLSLKAFYNAARNYYTGVVTPGLGVDPPPFYSATPLVRSAGGVGVLIGGVDGKVQLSENGALHPIAGARDWGSDFATIQSGCGAGVQIITSGSGEAAHDSLRAYELPALEAVPAGAPLGMEGKITALWSAPDGKSVLTIVQNGTDQYEVDRVTALCN